MVAVESPSSSAGDGKQRSIFFVLFGLAGVFLGLLSCLTVVDLDLFHEMALLREAWALGSLPRHDVFAYTPTRQPVVHHEWGTGAVLYAVCVQSGLGAAGLLALRYGLSAWIGAGSILCARCRGASFALFAFLTPLAIGLSWIGFTVIRAQVFTLAFLVALLWFLAEADRGRRWWIPLWLVLYTLWLNMHAGFLVGLGLFGLYVAERSARGWLVHRSFTDALRDTRWLWATLLAMLALLVVNPYGPAYIPYLWQAVRMPRPLIPEWSPLWRAAWVTQALFAFSLVVLIYVAVARGVFRVPGLILVALPAVLAWQHMRHLSLYAVVWSCLVPGWLAETRAGRELELLSRKRARELAWFWLICGSLGLALAGTKRFWELRIPTRPVADNEGLPIYPAGAVAYLAEQSFAGNLMVPFGAGAFVSWKLYPAVKVSLDSRYEVPYPAGAVEESVAFYRAEPGWQATLARYPTDAVLVPTTSELLPRLEASQGLEPAWKWIYRDDAYVVWVPEPAAARYPQLDRRGEPIVARFP